MDERGLGSGPSRARLVAADPTALAEVFDQYASFVFGLARRVIGDARAAEDVTQEVFVAVWERPDVFDPDRGTLRRGLPTLAHRRAVDDVRREEARRRRSLRDAARHAAAVPDVEELATAILAAEQVRAAARGAPRQSSGRRSSSCGTRRSHLS